jgi:hypothetical protein
MIALARRGTPYPETTMLPSRFSCREPAARTAPVSVLVSFAAGRERPRRTGPGRSSRSQTALACRERTPADWKACWDNPSLSTLQGAGNLSQLSHGLVGRHRTQALTLDNQWTMTWGYGL